MLAGAAPAAANPGTTQLMVRALEGITVLDLTDGPAGAIATMFLVDNGARVIHAMPSGGAATRADPAYRIWDRGKESVFLDVQTDADAFRRIAAASDVLIESWAPSSGVHEIAGYEALAPINRRLVHCSITAYGRNGPLRDEPAHPDLVMARAGILASQPSFDGDPIHVVHPLPQVGAGLLAAQGIVASLVAREKTGAGRKVETSLLAGALVYSPKVGGDSYRPRPYTLTPTGGTPFYSVMECSDGNWIHLGCIHLGFIERAAEAMGIAETVAQPKYGFGRAPETDSLRQEICDIVADAIRTKTYAEWAEIFERADVPYARASTAEQGMENEQAIHNEMIIEVDDPLLGRVAQMGVPIKLSQTPGRVSAAAPVPGEHTDAVLAEFTAEPASSADGPVSSAPPLQGIRVLELTNVLAGPTAGKMLADLGAEVVKMESPAGDISRSDTLSTFHYLNSNKRSISLNARTPAGRNAAQRLASRSDVLLANMRPGATGRLGLGSDDLAALNPRMVESHVTAFGWDGPYSHRAGVDPLAQALTGMERAQGGESLPPVYLAALAPTDFTGGALGALGALLCLYARESHGVMQKADTNLLGAGIVLSMDGFMRYEGKPARLAPQRHQRGLGALRRIYRARDGWLYLAADWAEGWSALSSASGLEAVDSDERFASAGARAENDGPLSDVLSELFASEDVDQWLGLLKGTAALCAPLAEGFEVGFFDSEQVAANDMIVELQHPTMGLLKLMRKGVSFPGSGDISYLPTPLLGEQGEAVLFESGLSPEEVAELRDSDVLRVEAPLSRRDTD